jgi:hypothetical protein
MNQRTLMTRLRNADPAAGRELVDDAGLRRARVEAILASGGRDPLAPTETARPRQAGRSGYRRAAAVAVAVAALPGAALAASAVFGPDDAERGLPAGAQILAGSNPVCEQVEDDVFDCKLTLPDALDAPDTTMGEPVTWTSLMVDSNDHITGGCRTHAEDASVWRCYAGEAAADQHLLDPASLGTKIHDRCDTPAASDAPNPLEAAPGSTIVLCGVHGVFGYSVSHDQDGGAAATARKRARPQEDPGP